MEVADARHRRSIRLKHRDYALPGPYFVTICAEEKRCIFGRIDNGGLVPTELGRLVRECWVSIPEHFPQTTLHAFVVMPNHVHGLIAILPIPLPIPLPTPLPIPLVGAQHCCALPQAATNKGVQPGSLGAIMRSFKAIVAKRAHKELGWNGPVWQRNYFERVLRDGREFSNASSYIAENPMKWEWDHENPQAEPHREL
jgi:putative transposase